MTKRASFSAIIVVVIGVLMGGFLWQSDAQAYWSEKDNDDGTKEQCFAIQYRYESEEKPTDNKFALSSGKSTRKDVKIWSTARMCAKVKDGKVVDTVSYVARPSGTSGFNGTLQSDGPNLDVCGANGSYGSTKMALLPIGENSCDGGNPIKTWNVKGKDFKSIAEEATNAAPSEVEVWVDALSKGKATKMSIDNNDNTRESQIKTDEEMGIEYPGEEDSDGTKSACYEDSGALGWILCPIIKGLSAAGESMWEAVSGMLNIPANETFNADSGVVVAWEAIRNIANILFIILLLVVIFSQLTGVGIDNYGIKRILPKMIMAAVLINLSYALCVVAVDVSNILGNSLEGLLASQAGPIDLGSEFSTGSTVAASMVDAALVGGGAYLFVLFSPLGIIGIGIAVVSVIIAIVTAIAFLYLILVIRQAGVILMVVLAPAAIVCYMLPNTEKIYKRWFDTFKALLVVYPICGAIVGAGQLASSVLGAIDNTAMKIAAMIVQVVPFFLIPTLLRNSLSLMGNIGQSLQNVAGRARRGATGVAANAMRNSERLKSLDNRLGMHSISSRRRANAVESEGAIMAARGKRGRLSDRNNIQTRLAAIAAAEEGKAFDEEVSQQLALMQNNGIMVGGQRRAYNLDSMTDRMNELSDVARRRELNHAERMEIATLMRGMSGEKGGGGSMGRVIRHSDGGTGRQNTNFMNAVGAAVSNDATVRGKLREKDAGASTYAERFTPGGDGASGDTFNDFRNQTDAQGRNIYDAGVQSRTPTYEAGLNQGGEALDEYIGGLTAQQCQDIYDTEAYKILSSNDLSTFRNHASNLGVTGKSAQRVVVDQGNGGGNP